MKKAYILLLLSTCVLFAVGQEFNNYWGNIYYLNTEIPDPQTPQNQENYYASDCIYLSEGFESHPAEEGHFKAKNLPLSIIPPMEGQTGGPNPGDNGVVGTIPGNLSVSPTGAAIYTIPIELPPGIAGMTPELALVYNSQGADGIMGQGWSIGGLSAISRTNHSHYYSDAIDDVDFENDLLTLDGSVLLKKEVSKNKDVWVEYRAEVDKFSKILANHSPGSYKINYFKEITKTGLTRYYGYNAAEKESVLSYGYDGNSTLSWHLDSISDRYGNSIEYFYTDFNQVDNPGEIYIKKILYTSNVANGIIGEYTVEFEYTQLNPEQRKIVFFHNGPEKYEYSNIRRVDKICVKHNGVEIKSYNLSYTQSGYFDEHYVSNIELRSGNKKFNSTSFLWNIHVNPIKDSLLIYNEDDVQNMFNFNPVTGDFNDDGFEDILILKDSYAPGDEPRMAVNNKNNTFGIKSVLYDVSDDPHITEIKSSVDLNGDNIPELIAYDENSNLQLYEIINDQNNDWDFIKHENIIELAGIEATLSGDFDGDGVNDLLIKESTENKIHIYRGSITEIIETDSFIEYSLGEANFLPGDFNGDGKTDFITLDISSSNLYMLNDNNDDFVIYPLPDLSAQMLLGIGEFNGDNKTDLYEIDDYDNLLIYYSYGVGFTPGATITGDFSTIKLYPSDLNGDGSTDFIIKDNGGTQWSSIQYMYISQRGQNTKKITYGPKFNFNPDSKLLLSTDVYSGKFNGTGKSDAIVLLNTEDITANEIDWKFYFCFDKDINSNSITSITNGIGLESAIQYTTLPRYSGYTRGDAYDDQLSEFFAPLYVATSLHKENGMGGFFPPTNYHYSMGITHRTGKGFLGFKSMTQLNYKESLLIRNTYDVYIPQNNYFYPYNDSTFIYTMSEGEQEWLISKTAYSLHHINTVANTKIFFPYINTSLTQQFESNADNELYKVSKTVSSEFDHYGNPNVITAYAGYDVYPDDDQFPFIEEASHDYFNDETNWVIGRLLKTQVTKKAPSVYSGTTEPDLIFRESQFEYYGIDSQTGSFDPTNPHYGKTQKEIIEPEVDLKWEKEYTYDSFGNILTTTESAPEDPSGPPQRMNETTYGISGRFVDEFINAEGHKTA